MKDVKNILVLCTKLIGTLTLAMWLVHGTIAIYFHTFHILGIIVVIALTAIVVIYAKKVWTSPIGNIILVGLGALTALNLLFSVVGALLHSGLLAMGLGAIITLVLVGSKSVTNLLNGKNKNEDK